MPYNDSLKKLYADWKKNGKYDSFCMGGVINEDRYKASKPKILFILKETNFNDYKGGIEATGDWSLVDYIKGCIKQGARGFRRNRTWEQVGIWSYGIFNGFPAYELIEKDFTKIADGLNMIAATNAKKTGGGVESKDREIKDWLIQTKRLWRDEINVLEPDIVICGGPAVTNGISAALNIKDKDWESAPGNFYYKKYGPWLLIDAYHPSPRGKKAEDKYDHLINGMRDLKGMGLW